MSAGSQPAGDRRHYSYEHYASRQVAEGFDNLRFGGPIGGYLLECQNDILHHAFAPVAGRRIVDVGTGTGRAAVPLAKSGARVVGLDASKEMLDVARARAAQAGVAVALVPGDAQALPFPDRSFDDAVSLRVIMHAPDWRQCIAELCRVSRSRVVVDFPASGSLAAVQSGVRRIAFALGRRTEPYRVLPERAVRDELRRGGFSVVAVHRQFVLPIAFHKTLGSLAATRAIEGALAALGLRRLLASPVTMVAER